MIDVNRIRSLKTLEEIKATLNEFLAHPDMKRAYVEDFGWGVEDYEADAEMVNELLERVERRMKSLSNHIKGQAKQRGSSSNPQPATKETPSEP